MNIVGLQSSQWANRADIEHADNGYIGSDAPKRRDQLLGSPWAKKEAAPRRQKGLAGSIRTREWPGWAALDHSKTRQKKLLKSTQISKTQQQ